MRKSKGNPSTNIFIAAAAIAVIAGGVVFLTQKGSTPKRYAGDDVVAQINGDPVYISEVEKQLSSLVRGGQGADFNKLDNQSKEVIIREIAAQKIILERAYKGGIDKKKAIQDKIQDYKESLLKEEFLASMAKDSVTEEKIKDRYNRDVKKLKGKIQYKAKHIVLNSESDAKAAKNLLATKSFEQVAKDKSVDEQTSLTGGDLGYLVSGSMVPEFENAISKLNEGGVSAPVKTQFGWHIIKLEEKKPAEPAPYDQVKNIIARSLFQEAITNYVKDALNSTKIDIVASTKEKQSPATDNKPATDIEKSESTPDKQG